VGDLVIAAETATLCPIPGLYETLELGKTVLSPEMVREAVPHFSSCIAKTLLTIGCRFYLRNIHNVVIPSFLVISIFAFWHGILAQREILKKN
jgi:hypothetical protein